MGRYLGITRSSYYRWLKHPKSDNEIRNEQIADIIREIGARTMQSGRYLVIPLHGFITRGATNIILNIGLIILWMERGRLSG